MQLLRDDFVGDWSINRTIIDHLHGLNGKMIGAVSFRPDGDSVLNYDERGTMTLGTGTSMPATRTYKWAFSEGSVAVAFSDGKPFHNFVPCGAAIGTDHLCGADLYRVQYDFTDWPTWKAIWSVKGPRKDYISQTNYTLQASSVSM